MGAGNAAAAEGAAGLADGYCSRILSRRHRPREHYRCARIEQPVLHLHLLEQKRQSADETRSFAKTGSRHTRIRKKTRRRSVCSLAGSFTATIGGASAASFSTVTDAAHATPVVPPRTSFPIPYLRSRIQPFFSPAAQRKRGDQSHLNAL